MKPNNIILEGITGSKAYGLDTETSDEDIKGIYVAPTQDILGIFNVKETYDHVDPDFCYHEVGKFIQLAIKANPTIYELLFLDGYLVLEKFGKILVDNRHLFLSNTVRHSYGGYALSQAKELLETGTLSVRVSPELRKEIFAFGELPVNEVIDTFEQKFKEFDLIKSVLPDKPDMEGINKLLLKIRKGNYS